MYTLVEAKVEANPPHNGVAQVKDAISRAKQASKVFLAL
jgi:hypothetical protein